MFTRQRLLRNVSSLSKRCFASNEASSTHFDIIVAGGGMVGTTLTCTLGKNTKLSQKKILLLEGGKNSEWKLPPEYSNRVSSLSMANFNLLNEIDAWKHIEAARFGTIKRMQVWDAMSEAAISFDRNEANQPVAHVVENDLLLDAVRKEMKDLCDVEVVYEAKIKNCKAGRGDDEKVTVCMEDGSKYTCELLLGCDGANSVVAKTMGFHHVALNYNHMGVVATLKLPEDSPNTVAWQRHLPNSGFLAILPLKDGLSSMVWSTEAKEANNLVQLPEDQFVDAINEALWKSHPRPCLIDDAVKTFDNLIRFFNFSSSSMTQCPPKILGCDINSRAMFPLGLKHATNYVGRGVALVGDAAHRIHPLAGQGVNLGFGDVICLNKLLGEAAYAGSRLGSLMYLKEYETERQRHNVPMMTVVHGLFHLYSTQFTPVVILRSLGLQATHAFTPLKRLLISQASGLPYWET